MKDVLPEQEGAIANSGPYHLVSLILHREQVGRRPEKLRRLAHKRLQSSDLSRTPPT